MDWTVYHYINLLCLILSLHLKDCFVWYKYTYPYSLLLFIYMEYLFPSLHFSPICALKVKWVIYRQHIVGSFFPIHLAALCVLIGVFNPIYVIDSYRFTIVILIVFLAFCRSFVCSSSLLSSFVIWFFFFSELLLCIYCISLWLSWRLQITFYCFKSILSW
jgi:hypothetical protein